MAELLLGELGFDALHTKTTELHTKLQEVYEQTVKLKDKINNSQWEGRPKLEFEAFLNLVEQYHKLLLEEPLAAQKTSMETLDTELLAFLDGFWEYNNLD